MDLVLVHLERQCHIANEVVDGLWTYKAFLKGFVHLICIRFLFEGKNLKQTSKQAIMFSVMSRICSIVPNFRFIFVIDL